jgi:hypothetical protein
MPRAQGHWSWTCRKPLRSHARPCLHAAVRGRGCNALMLLMRGVLSGTARLRIGWLIERASLLSHEPVFVSAWMVIHRKTRHLTQHKRVLPDSCSVFPSSPRPTAPNSPGVRDGSVELRATDDDNGSAAPPGNSKPLKNTFTSRASLHPSARESRSSLALSGWEWCTPTHECAPKQRHLPDQGGPAFRVTGTDTNPWSPPPVPPHGHGTDF